MTFSTPSALGSLLAPPRPLVRAGVAWLRRKTGARLAQPDRDLRAQQAMFAERLAALARCQVPAAYGIRTGMSHAEFARQVPLFTYEDFVPAVERMRAGDADVLAPGRCAHYAVSSGTTAGRTKFLPVNEAMVAHFRKAGLDSLLYFAHRTGSTEVFNGRHLFLGGSTALQEYTSPAGFRSWSGDLSGITALNLPGWVERHLYEPGRDLALVSDWPSKIEAIAERTRGRDISLVAGIPSWLLILSEALLKGSAAASVGDLWPGLRCLIHGGVPIAPYTDSLRQAFGERFSFHEVFPASEGFIAAQDAEPEAGLRLMANHGIFFEFIPLRDFDESKRADLGSRCLTLADVETDVDYVLVMTTPAGLFRYVIGDVVRFVSRQPARLVYAGRTRLQLSAFGEHVSERDLTRALAEACRKHGIDAAHFHVGPRFAEDPRSGSRGRHEWVVELREGQRIDNVDTLAADLDRLLMRDNDDYEAKRLGGGLTSPLVHLAPAGTFRTWMEGRGKWGGQNKMPRCRSDRAILDTLLAGK